MEVKPAAEGKEKFIIFMEHNLNQSGFKLGKAQSKL